MVPRNVLPAHNNRLQRPVRGHRRRAASAPFHYALASLVRVQPFFCSPFDGLRNNARLIRAIAPVLIETTDGKVDGSFARQSLDSLTAKVWLAENGNKVCRECPGCEGEWSSPQDDEPELRNGRWELCADKRGRKAPYLTKLRVFGGFLNANRDEWVAARKRRHSHEIHDFGWS